MVSETWTEGDIPDQSGRVCVVTGANSGLGLETARALAAHGASVVLAVRSLDKGAEAVARIRAATPDADLHLQQLDLSSLDSIRSPHGSFGQTPTGSTCSSTTLESCTRPRQKTTDGFELQLGTNHIGHFALTGLLLDRLLPVEGSRIVTVSSIAHRILSRIDFDDLQAPAPLQPGLRLRPIQTGQPPVHLRTAAASDRGGSPDGGARRPSRRLAHRSRTSHSRRTPAAAAGAMDDPARRGRRAADPARRHRPERRGRPVLRPGRHHGDAGSPCARHLESPISRRRHAAATVGRVRGVDRCLLPARRTPIHRPS